MIFRPVLIIFRPNYMIFRPNYVIALAVSPGLVDPAHAWQSLQVYINLSFQLSIYPSLSIHLSICLNYPSIHLI